MVAVTIHGIIEKENDDKVDALINPEDKSGSLVLLTIRLMSTMVFN